MDTVEAADLILKIRDLGLHGEVAPLIQLLKENPSKVVRSAAAIMLAGFQEKGVIEALLGAVLDPEDWVRNAAVNALSYMGAEEAEETIGQAAKDESPRVANAVPGALERISRGPSISFSTVDQGRNSQSGEPIFKNIKSEKEWTEFWAKHKPSQSPPAIDFSEESILAVFLGKKRGADSSIRIVEVQEKSDFLRVIIETSYPEDPGEATSYQIVRLPKTDLAVHMVRRPARKND